MHQNKTTRSVTLGWWVWKTITYARGRKTIQLLVEPLEPLQPDWVQWGRDRGRGETRGGVASFLHMTPPPNQSYSFDALHVFKSLFLPYSKVTIHYLILKQEITRKKLMKSKWFHTVLFLFTRSGFNISISKLNYTASLSLKMLLCGGQTIVFFALFIEISRHIHFQQHPLLPKHLLKSSRTA